MKKRLLEVWELFRAWRKARSVVRSMKLFQRLIMDKSTGMEEIVKKNAMRMASSMAMTYFDSKGIIHCRFCHDTEQLWNHLDYKVCSLHREKLLAVPSTNGKEVKPTQKQEASNG